MITDTPERKSLRSRLGKLKSQRLNHEAKIALIDQEIEEVKAKLDAGKVRRGGTNMAPECKNGDTFSECVDTDTISI